MVVGAAVMQTVYAGGVGGVGGVAAAALLAGVAGVAAAGLLVMVVVEEEEGEEEEEGAGGEADAAMAVVSNGQLKRQYQCSATMRRTMPRARKFVRALTFLLRQYEVAFPSSY